MERRRSKTRVMLIVVLAVVMLIGILIFSSINTRVRSYPYNEELPKPGYGVDITNDGPLMRVYIWWNKVFNQAASKAWKVPEGVVKKELSVTARDGSTIGGYILEPENSGNGEMTTMLYCHGGAFFMPILPSSLACGAFYAEKLNCRVYMPEYRLTPANPYPVPVNDCYDTLTKISKLPETDKDRVIIYGESAGGCLAAEVMHMCRDESLLEPLALMLIYPVTDNAQQYPSLTEYEKATWSREANLNMWKLYLAGRDPMDLEYAVPILQEDFSDYPPVYLEPSEMDTLRDQDIAYAGRMREAGVKVTEEVIPGAYHGFDGDVNNPMVRGVLENRVKWLTEVENGTAE